MRRFAAFLLLIGLFAFPGGARAEIRWEIARTLPHDTRAFTQGLFIADGLLYESTGLVGRSELRALRLEDGELLRSQPIPKHLFGEGIAPWGDRLVSLTWRDGQGFIWRRKDFKQLGRFTYEGEGWGLTSSADAFIMSDGTAELRVLDPETMKEIRRVTVTWDDTPVRFLNELEYVEGKVYANIWYSPLIARIDPNSGMVEDWINLTPLVTKNARNSEAVLNGIAWDPETRLLYVTGKNWPNLYALRLIEDEASNGR